MKSVNVTLRTSLGLFANIPPCVAYHLVVDPKHPGMDVVRENEEDVDPRRNMASFAEAGVQHLNDR